MADFSIITKFFGYWWGNDQIILSTPTDTSRASGITDEAGQTDELSVPLKDNPMQCIPVASSRVIANLVDCIPARHDYKSSVLDF